MAINKTYRDKGIELKNAYIRVERIWGSKAEGWNCWVGVYAAEGDAATAIPLFSVNAPYIEGENPFTALYKAIEVLPQLQSDPALNPMRVSADLMSLTALPEDAPIEDIKPFSPAEDDVLPVVVPEKKPAKPKKKTVK